MSTSEEAPEWATNLANNMAAGFAQINKRMTDLESDVSRRLGGLEGRMTTAEQRLTNSDRPPSHHDLGQDQVIARLVTDVSSLKGDMALVRAGVLEISKILTGFATNPTVLWCGRILVLILAAYAAGKGIKVLP